MTVQENYTESLRRTQDAWVSAADAWTQNFQKIAGQTPGVPFSADDAAAAVDRFFDFAEQLLEASREYAKNLADVATAFTGAVRQHVDSVSDVVREQVEATTDVAKEQVDKLEDAAEEQVGQAKEAARAQYDGWTRAELVEELGRRELPKTGTVDELRDRLAEADTE
jgi:hypothetical protein